jgi:5'-nucleotidase
VNWGSQESRFEK